MTNQELERFSGLQMQVTILFNALHAVRAALPSDLQADADIALAATAPACGDLLESLARLAAAGALPVPVVDLLARLAP